MNFTELPLEYKSKLKSTFIEYDFVEDTKKKLLGGSRVDIAALVIQKTISDFLAPNGNACFFQPLSILLNDGAHGPFCRYSVKGVHFAVEKVFDFNDVMVFPDVSTHHGLVQYKKNELINFPIPYYRNISGRWLEQRAAPILSSNGPLNVFDIDESAPLFNFELIPLQKSSKPRQGINTSGANRVFIFHSYEDIDADTCKVNDTFLLPKRFIYPLLVSYNFKDSRTTQNRRVLIPYTRNGRPLEKKTILGHHLVWDYP